METFIRVKKEELNHVLIQKLNSLISGIKNPEITIRISNNSDKNYFDKLDESIKQFDRGEVISFAMDELIEYIKTDK